MLGILIMNAITFVLPKSAYYNPSSAGTDNILDWIFVTLSQIFIAEKMMGLFSLLFGASIVLFIPLMPWPVSAANLQCGNEQDSLIATA